MGKGDKKSKRGKIIMGSYGVRRPQKPRSLHTPVPVTKDEKPEPKAKAAAEVHEVAAVVEDAAKPARKKTAPKATAKKEAKSED
jgi:ribosomal small subunit protein bTHX